MLPLKFPNLFELVSKVNKETPTNFLYAMLQVIKWKLNEEVATSSPDSAAALH